MKLIHKRKFFHFFMLGILALLVLDVRILASYAGASFDSPSGQTIDLEFKNKKSDRYKAYRTRANKKRESNVSNTNIERTFESYYNNREFLGSPPSIPHTLEDTCLVCHEKGGFTIKLGKFTPVTPHPEHDNCKQCHVRKVITSKFKEVDPIEFILPTLGSVPLPGGPPYIPHEVNTRKKCMECHTGFAAISSIRVTHSSRGTCTQCHVNICLADKR